MARDLQSQDPVLITRSARDAADEVAKREADKRRAGIVLWGKAIEEGVDREETLEILRMVGIIEAE
jgi:hypothetical protein